MTKWPNVQTKISYKDIHQGYLTWGNISHEDLSWTGKFQVNSSLSSCICINNFQFRDSLYLLNTSYPNITGGLSFLMHKLGCPKRPIIQIFQYGESLMTQNCPFSNPCRPYLLSLTAAFKPKFPTSKDPFYTGEYFLKIPHPDYKVHEYPQSSTEVSLNQTLPHKCTIASGSKFSK